MLLQDLDAVPTVCHVEMVPHPDSGAGRPWSPRERALALASGIGEADIIYLGEVLVLDHQEPVPVDIWLCSL